MSGIEDENAFMKRLDRFYIDDLIKFITKEEEKLKESDKSISFVENRV